MRALLQIPPLAVGEDMPDQEPPLGTQTLYTLTLAPSIPLLVLPPRAPPPPPPAACGGRPWSKTLHGHYTLGGLTAADYAEVGHPEGLAAEAALGAKMGSVAARERAEAELPDQAAMAGLDADAAVATLGWAHLQSREDLDFPCSFR